MALLAWPESLPCPLVGGRLQVVEPFVSFKADKPFSDKRRRVTTISCLDRDVALWLTVEQWETLLGFYHDDPPSGLGGGIDRFTFTDRLTWNDYEVEFIEGAAPVLNDTGSTKHDVTMRWRLYPA